MLTGDSLFVGDIARPDLAVDKREGAQGIFRSLHEQLLSLPDTTEVWPAHLGGSMCGGPGMDLKVSSTIGFERASQPLLQVREEDDFVEQVTAGDLTECKPRQSNNRNEERNPQDEDVDPAAAGRATIVWEHHGHWFTGLTLTFVVRFVLVPTCNLMPTQDGKVT